MEQLDVLIENFEKELRKRKKVSAGLIRQLKQFRAIQKTLKVALDAGLSTDRLLEEDDWKVLLKNSKLSPRGRAALLTLLEANKDYSNPKEFV